MGGTDVKQVTLTVYQPPTVNLSGPQSLNYGQQGTLVYESTDVDVSFVLEPTYTYKNGSATGAMFNTNLPLGAISNGTITTNIPYNDYGPTSVTYTLTGTGNGGQETKQITVPIIIDETPENFLVPETDDAFKSQEPIYSPNSDVTSYEIIVDGVDIPVEIKADKPILVEINDDDTWDQLRSI
jgi:hypothetical protein